MNNLRIMCIGNIVNGEIDWRISALPPAEDEQAFNAACDERFDSPPTFSHFAHLFPDGSLQRVIDYGARVSEEEDARMDEEFNRRGGWL